LSASGQFPVTAEASAQLETEVHARWRVALYKANAEFVRWLLWHSGFIVPVDGGYLDRLRNDFKEP